MRVGDPDVNQSALLSPRASLALLNPPLLTESLLLHITDELFGITHRFERDLTVHRRLLAPQREGSHLLQFSTFWRMKKPNDEFCFAFRRRSREAPSPARGGEYGTGHSSQFTALLFTMPSTGYILSDLPLEIWTYSSTLYHMRPWQHHCSWWSPSTQFKCTVLYCTITTMTLGGVFWFQSLKPGGREWQSEIVTTADAEGECWCKVLSGAPLCVVYRGERRVLPLRPLTRPEWGG